MIRLFVDIRVRTIFLLTLTCVDLILFLIVQVYSYAFFSFYIIITTRGVLSKIIILLFLVQNFLLFLNPIDLITIIRALKGSFIRKRNRNFGSKFIFIYLLLLQDDSLLFFYILNWLSLRILKRSSRLRI